MKHGEAIEWLAEYAVGSAPRTLRSALELHVGDCSACQQWLETHRLLAELLAPVDGSLSPPRHPEPEILGLCAARPEEIDELDRADILAHVASCSTCREDIDTVRLAVLEARPRQAPTASDSALAHRVRSRPGNSATPWLLAAACVLAALLPVALLRDRVGEPGAPGTPRSATPQGPARPVDRIENLDIQGRQLIGGEGTLKVAHVQVRPGAHVTLRAAQAVQLGSGFRIEQGGSLAVEVAAEHTPSGYLDR